MRVADPPTPGAHTGQVCWTSRRHYLSVVVPLALQLYPEALTRHGVDRDTVVSYVAVLAEAADHGSGRRVQLTNPQIAAAVGCSTRHVRRCRRVAEDLGLYRTITPGRLMTKVERLRAWKDGSRHRGLANEAALVVPRWLVPHLPSLSVSPATLLHTPTSSARSGDDVHPPSGSAVGTTQTVSSRFVARSARTASPASTAPGRVITPTVPTHRDRNHAKRKKPRAKPSKLRAGYRLACAVIRHIRWLHKVEPGRMAGGLARFERAGWTAIDVRDAIEQMHARLGWDSPTTASLRAPGWGLFAWYLARLDVQADHPRVPVGPHPQAGERLAAGSLTAEREQRLGLQVDPSVDDTTGSHDYRAARAALRQRRG